MKKFKALTPITKSGYLRTALLLLGFYFAVNSLSGRKTLNQAVLLEDLRKTAHQLGQISQNGYYPQSLQSLNYQGVITSDLLDRCREANVTYHPENVANKDGLPVFVVPTDKRTTLVTPEGFMWRDGQTAKQ